ncbi:hypothetical protein Nstercoris_01034 [Nitrosomonas stercoris]|uniref:Uncharacterized protein n=1 Tax=Nitrosomonas stercoris TaxID=1444684 RepID=A0A4Y1YP44_9PROT|nr:hypothetical protein Nstercoris_01034 [Nitrosomonas stercoris]
MPGGVAGAQSTMTAPYADPCFVTDRLHLYLRYKSPNQYELGEVVLVDHLFF